MAEVPWIQSCGVPVWSQRQASIIDHESQQAGYRSGSELMEQAGSQAFGVLCRYFASQRPLVVLAGVGNNGGDALVLARLAIAAGWQCRILVVGDRDKLTPSTAESLAKIAAENAQIASYETGCLRIPMAQGAIFVDGLLGLGFKGPLRPGVVADCLNELRSYGRQDILAIDMPSGMSADSWRDHLPLVAATVTVTFGSLKFCHALEPTRSMCGLIVVCDPGFQPAAVAAALADDEPGSLRVRTVGVEQLSGQKPMSALPDDAHKFHRGHVLIVGGSTGKLGAPLLAAHGALHSGAGWVSLATPFGTDPLPQAPLEVTYEPFYAKGRLDLAALLDFCAERRVTSLVIGPGMAVNPMVAQEWRQLAAYQRQSGLFVVIDAGALHGCGDLFEPGDFDARLTVLTPHPGEWQKLAQNNAPLAITDRASLQAAVAWLARLGVTCIYKTATPVVVAPLRGILGAEGDPVSAGAMGAALNSPSGLAVVLSEADAAFAKAGFGDVLAGTLGALGPFCEDGAVAAVTAQATVFRGARLAKKRFGKHGVTPSTVVANLGF